MKTLFQISIYLTILILKATSEEKTTNTISVSPGPGASSAGQSSTIQKLIKILEKYGLEEQRGLKRVYLSNRSITCNDGSKSGFYLRKSHGSKRWIIFLEGGWYCYDHKTCRNRWLRLRHLMTSTQWPDTRDVGGLLSANPEENPFWWNANHVFVPYCTSDSWSGTRASTQDMFSFMGAEIVSQVVKDLIPLGLENASSLLLAGSSAGGTGVMLNLDRVQNLVHRELGLKEIAIRGVSDSGWFLDRVPYSPNGLTPVDAVRKGMQLWKPRISPNCLLHHSDQPWRCYFGYRLYPTLTGAEGGTKARRITNGLLSEKDCTVKFTAPLFVFQWLFDEAQMSADNVGAPVTKQQWDYVHKMGDSLRQTFENVSAVFAPSCISHSVLTKRDWQLVKVDDISLAQALHCWEQIPVGSQRNESDDSLIETNQPCTKPLKKLLRSGPTKGNITWNEYPRSGMNRVGQPVNGPEKQSAGITGRAKVRARARARARTRARASARARARPREKKKRNGRKHKARRLVERKKDGKDGMVKHERQNSSGRRRGSKQEDGQSDSSALNGMRTERSVGSSGKRKCTRGSCHFRLIERCTWPQCNHSCPKLHNPFTGEEMDFIELLKSFGLDMKSVASALGIDIQALNTMDHDELLNLLTQRAN